MALALILGQEALKQLALSGAGNGGRLRVSLRSQCEQQKTEAALTIVHVISVYVAAGFQTFDRFINCSTGL